MKTLIQIPSDGDCLFNAILIGYLDSHHGQYPVINGIEIRTQHQLREAVRQYYQTRIDGSDETLIECLKGMLIDIIKLKKFSGFSKTRTLKKKLENILDHYDLLIEDQTRENLLNGEVNQDLIQLYVDSITSIWGSGQEILILGDLLHTNIRSSGHRTTQNNEIELNYVGGNHYNVRVRNISNGEVSSLVRAIGGEQISEDASFLTDAQALKMSTLSDYEFHLFLQIIYNKREAEQRGINTSITDEEVNYAFDFLKLRSKEAKTNQLATCDVKQIPMSPIVDISIRDIENYHDDLSKDTSKFLENSRLFQTPPRKTKINLDFSEQIDEITTTLKRTGLEEEGYYTDFDDSSGDEADKKAESYTFTKKKEFNSYSYATHAFGIKLLWSPEVKKFYKVLKKKLLRNGVDIIKQPKWPIYDSIYFSIIKIISNPSKVHQAAKKFLDTQTELIHDLEKILIINIKTIRENHASKLEIKKILQKRCSKIFEEILSNLRDYIQNYNIEDQVTHENNPTYISKLSDTLLRSELSSLFDQYFYLTDADKEILKTKEVGVLTEKKADICTSTSKRKQIEKLKLDDTNLQNLSLSGKAVLKTLQEVIPNSGKFSDFKSAYKGKLLKHYISLLIEEAKKEGFVLDADNNFHSERYENSVFQKEGIRKSLFKISDSGNHNNSSSMLQLKDTVTCADLINDVIEHLYDKLVFVTSSRKTLELTHMFDFTDLQQIDENLFPHYLSTLRISNRSIRREIRNKEDAKKSQDYMTDSIFYRYWNFPHDGAEYAEQQTLNEYLTRTDYAMFGTQSSSYPSIVEHIEVIKQQLNKYYIIVNDSSIAKHIRAIFCKNKLDFNDIYGSIKEKPDRNIGAFETKEINKMITRVVGLIFGTETQRNPAALIHIQMILDLIESGAIKFSEAFYSYQGIQPERNINTKSQFTNVEFIMEDSQGIKFWLPKGNTVILTWDGYETNFIVETIKINAKKLYILKDKNSKQMIARAIIEKGKTEAQFIPEPLMPMAPTDSTSMAVSLNQHYKEHMPYPYIHNGARNEDFSSLIAAEDILVKLWAQKIASLDINKVDYVILAIARSCKEWYGIEVESQQLIIDILSEEFEEGISDEELNALSMNQLNILEEISSSYDKDDILRLHDNGNILSLSKIISLFQKSKKKFETLAHQKVIDFYHQLQEWDEDVSFEDICDLYDSSEDKLWDLIHDEDDLISEYGFTRVSNTYDDIFEECGGNDENYTGYDEDGEEYNIYVRVYNRLLKEENGSDSDEDSNNSSYEDNSNYLDDKNGSSSDEEISVNFCFIKYDNEILNNPKGQELFELAAKSKNLKAINLLLELGKDKFFAEQMMFLLDELGAERVLESLFDDKIEGQKQNTDTAKELDPLPQTQDQKTLVDVAKIEAIIGKDELFQITGFYQYVSSAFSSSHYAAFSAKVINALSNLIENLQDTLEFSSLYQNIALANQAAIILAQLDNIFNFIASGPMQAGLAPRPPYFDPDDDFAGFGDGGGSINNAENSTDTEIISIPLYIGVNSTFIDI